MDRTVVITGGGGVLCGCFAEFFAKKGDKVAVLDINLTAAEKVCEKITSDGGVAKAYQCNVLDKENIENVHTAILSDFGKCDILVNGAGGNHPSCTTLHEEYVEGDELQTEFNTFFNLTDKGFNFVFDLNLKSVLLISQVFIKDMLGRKGCCVLNVSSMNAYTPLTKIPAYSAAKSGVSNLTSWMAVHFAKQGIRVNAIAPGFFVTAQNKQLLYNEDGTPTKRTEKILNATPMGRFGDADELLGVIELLTDGEKAGFVTGITVPVDGGFSAYSGV